MNEKIVPEPRPGPVAEHDKEKAPKEPVRQEDVDAVRPGPITEDEAEKAHDPRDGGERGGYPEAEFDPDDADLKGPGEKQRPG